MALSGVRYGASLRWGCRRRLCPRTLPSPPSLEISQTRTDPPPLKSLKRTLTIAAPLKSLKRTLRFGGAGRGAAGVGCAGRGVGSHGGPLLPCSRAHPPSLRRLAVHAPPTLLRARYAMVLRARCAVVRRA
eukprot:2802711-Rhodomonas_salina.4